MGGCCCCSSRRAELSSRSPVYYYCPQSLEEHNSLSSAQGTASAGPTALLVDTNLETSFPDTYQAPPVPLPFDLATGLSQTLPGTPENSGSGRETVVTCEILKDSDYKSETDIVPGSPKTYEAETLKPSEPVISTVDEEDVCPTCFEGDDIQSQHKWIVAKYSYKMEINPQICFAVGAAKAELSTTLFSFLLAVVGTVIRKIVMIKFSMSSWVFPLKFTS